MNSFISLILRPFMGRITAAISSVILALAVKVVGALVAKHPELSSVVDPNVVADFVLIALLIALNAATNALHIGQYTQPVIDGLTGEEAKLKAKIGNAGCCSTQGAVLAIVFAAIAGLALTFLTGCANGKYVGPSVGISGGYNGVTVGFTLFGENPVLKSPVVTGTATVSQAAVQ